MNLLKNNKISTFVVMAIDLIGKVLRGKWGFPSHFGHFWSATVQSFVASTFDDILHCTGQVVFNGAPNAVILLLEHLLQVQQCKVNPPTKCFSVIGLADVLDIGDDGMQSTAKVDAGAKSTILSILD